MRRCESWIQVRLGAVRALFAVVCVVTFALLAAGVTSAAAKPHGGAAPAPTPLGGAAPGDGTCATGFWHAQIGEATASYTVPPGVWRLTSWSMWGSSGSVSFLVLRPAAGTAYRVVYASAAHSLTGGINTFADSVPVLGGDKIGFLANSVVPGCFVLTGNSADTVGWNLQPSSPGSIVDPAAPPSPCNGCESQVRWNLGATVEPITKHDCKKGGWKAWPVFKNRGDCVSYVATGGKNKPARGSKPCDTSRSERGREHRWQENYGNHRHDGPNHYWLGGDDPTTNRPDTADREQDRRW
jgi:hypothetical protein